MWKDGNLIHMDEKVELFRAHLNSMPRGDDANPLYCVRVKRERIVDDVLKLFTRLSKAQLLKKFIVMYHGESGVDAGGLTKDMFCRFFAEVTLPEHGLFETCSGTAGPGSLVLPRGDCDRLDVFEAFGRIIAKCIMDMQIVSAPIAPTLFRHLLPSGSAQAQGSNMAFADLAAFDAELHTRLKDNVLGVNITPDYSEALGDFEGLCVNGEKRRVTNKNKGEYVALLAYQKLVTSRSRQLDAVRKGFDMFNFSRLLQRFSPSDLSLLLMGSTEITPQIVMDNIDWTLGNWGKRAGTLAHIKRYLREATTDAPGGITQMAALRRFVAFVTGSPNLPYGGLKNLEPPSGKIVFTRLPVAGGFPPALAQHRRSSRLQQLQNTPHQV